MGSKPCKSMVLISTIIISILFSCATGQQKQIEPRDTEFYKDRRVISDAKVQTEIKFKGETLSEDYRVIQRIKVPAKGDCVDSLVLSPDGKKLAYLWKEAWVGGTNYSIWIDDKKVSPDFSFISEEGIAFCSNGSKVAYCAEGSSNNMSVWVNSNKISPEFYRTFDVAFGPDCSKVAYRAVTHRDYGPKARGKNSIWINGTRLSPEGSSAYSGVGKTLFSPDGSKVAYIVYFDKKRSVWINDKRVSPEFDGEMFHDLIFSPDGSRVAYTVRYDNAPSIWINDKLQFINAGGPAFSPDGSKLAYYSYKEKSVYINDKKVSPELGFSHRLVFSPDGSKVAYYVSEGKKKSVWINDKRVSPEFSADLIWDLVFSPDSSSVAYRVTYGEHECIWINDKKMSPDLRRIKFAKEHFSKTGEVIFAGLDIEKQEILHAATVEHVKSVTAPTEKYFGEVTTIDITEYGIYKAEVIKSGTSLDVFSTVQTPATLIEQTEKIPAKLGTRFGFRYTINGYSKGEKVDITFKIISPVIKRPNDNKEFSAQEVVIMDNAIGYNTYCEYVFEKTWEMVPGEWRLQLFHSGKKLAEKIFYVYKP
jgi:Tol biopolymer transport system component